MVVAMPKPENLERRVNVAEFALSQDSKIPPKPRRPVTPSKETKMNSHHSTSPRRRRLSNSRDIVQEVYDRIGVNYVRGQNSAEIYDSNGSSLMKSEVSKLSNITHSDKSRPPEVSACNVTQSSSLFGKAGKLVSVDTRNETRDEDRDERCSVRSTRSVKSLMSAFGGGKSVTSAKSIASRSSFNGSESPSIQKISSKSTIKIINTNPGEGVREKIIDCRDDNDMDATMSILSLDEFQWTNRKQQKREEEGKLQASQKGDIQSRRTSFQNSTSNTEGTVAEKPTLKTPDCHSSTAVDYDFSTGPWDDSIDKVIEEKLQAKIAVLHFSFEEKIRCLEEHTKRRLEEIETKLAESSKRKDFDSSTLAQNLRE